MFFKEIQGSGSVATSKWNGSATLDLRLRSFPLPTSMGSPWCVPGVDGHIRQLVLVEEWAKSSTHIFLKRLFFSAVIWIWHFKMKNLTLICVSIYCMSKKSWLNLCGNLLYKMGQGFLGRQYEKAIE